MDIHEILKSQREFFHTGATLSVDFRIRMLKKMNKFFMFLLNNCDFSFNDQVPYD